MGFLLNMTLTQGLSGIQSPPPPPPSPPFCNRDLKQTNDGSGTEIYSHQIKGVLSTILVLYVRDKSFLISSSVAVLCKTT